MSLTEQISVLIEQMYNLDRILTAMEKRPRAYLGVSLYSNEAHTLKQIAQNEGISQAELSERMYRTKGATSIAVDKLVEKGLIRREREEDNQRRYLLTLTDLGHQVNEAHLRYDEEHALWASEHLGAAEEELETTSRVLAQVIALYSQRYLEHGVRVDRMAEESAAQ